MLVKWRSAKYSTKAPFIHSTTFQPAFYIRLRTPYASLFETHFQDRPHICSQMQPIAQSASDEVLTPQRSSARRGSLSQVCSFSLPPSSMSDACFFQDHDLEAMRTQVDMQRIVIRELEQKNIEALALVEKLQVCEGAFQLPLRPPLI